MDTSFDKQGLMTFCVVAGMVITGTATTLATKIMFTTEAINMDGELRVFRKPWFGSFSMLLGMAFVGLVDKCWRLACRKPTIQLTEGGGLLQDTEDERAHMTYTEKVFRVAIPAALGLIATAACCIAILYIPASAWQMFRGVAFIFVAIFSVTFLKRRLFLYQYFGILLSVVGAGLVGWANVLRTGSGDVSGESSGRNHDIAFVVFLTSTLLIGQILQAGQVTAEEWLLKDIGLPPLVIIGWEGVWGVLMFIIIVYPALYLLGGSDHGHQEDLVDTLVMIKNSDALFAVVMTDFFSCATLQASGIAVTGALSAVQRMLLDASRTILIWTFGLIVHYCFDRNSKFGEAWTSRSFIEVFGFFLLVSGQATYGGLLRAPCCEHPEE